MGDAHCEHLLRNSLVSVIHHSAASWKLILSGFQALPTIMCVLSAHDVTRYLEGELEVFAAVVRQLRVIVAESLEPGGVDDEQAARHRRHPAGSACADKQAQFMTGAARHTRTRTFMRGKTLLL